MRNWQGSAAGTAEACWCGQPPAVSYTPILYVARNGWGPIRAIGHARRFVPVFRCARHAQKPPSGYTTELLTERGGMP